MSSLETMESEGPDALPETSERCPGCGTLPYPGDRYCACCGRRLPPHCRSCGSRISHPIANYCSRCGAPAASAGPMRIGRIDGDSPI